MAYQVLRSGVWHQAPQKAHSRILQRGASPSAAFWRAMLRRESGVKSHQRLRAAKFNRLLVELADISVLETEAERRRGSTPLRGTKFDPVVQLDRTTAF